MCMGGGGGSVPSAKINEHKKERKKASKDLNKIVKAIDRVAGSELLREGVNADDTPLLAAQQLLHQSNASLQGVMGQAAQLMQAAASSQAIAGQNALQMASLLGPPPPEKTAQKVLVGKARDNETGSTTRRNSLRIDPLTSA